MGTQKLQSFHRMQLFYYNNETVQNCILNMELLISTPFLHERAFSLASFLLLLPTKKISINTQIYLLLMQKLPSDSIQVISRADDGVESNLNASFFCEGHISAKSVIQIGVDHSCPDDEVNAIILCAMVVVKTSTAADMINDFTGGCDQNPWLKFEVRQREWLIASVITNPNEIHRYILDKGYYFPSDYIFTDQAVTEDVMVRKGYKVTLTRKKGQKYKALNLLRKIVDQLF